MFARSVRNGVSAGAVLVASVSVSFACPNLSGTFDCPAGGGMPASLLVVTNKPSGLGTTEYTFTYKIGGKDFSLKAEASEKGVRKPDGQTNSCNATSYIHKDAGQQGEGSRAFINAAGNFERTAGGKTETVCVRK